MASCTTFVNVDDLHFEDNVRSEQCLDIPGIVASYKRAGCFKVNHPLVVSAKDNGKLLVLNGNRRGIGLVFLRDNDPSEYKRICPKGRVPAVVHKGLTVEEEVDLRIDHSSDEDRVPLDEWSIFLAIRQLVGVGIDTQENIARKLGLYKTKGKDLGKPNRQIVQPRVNLARLPRFVQDEFGKLCLDKSSTAVRWSHISGLYKAYNTEYVEHPNADGPLFQAAWEKALTPIERQETTNDAKELSPASAVQRSQAASSEGLKSVLLVVTNQSDLNLATIDAKILEGETALSLLTSIQAYLGETEYAELVSAATQQTEETDGNDHLSEEEIGELVEA